MIAFMCGGVPSYQGTLDMLRSMGVEDPEDVVEFRYRGFGWPGRATAILSDGTEKSLDYDRAWGGILSKAVQFRCKICADGTGELADITFADGWHLGPDKKPIFEEREGRSMVMVRTELAKNLFAKAVASGCIQTQALPLEELMLIQPHQAARKASVAARLAAMATLRLPRTRYYNLNLGRLALRRGLVPNLRNYFGMIRRLLNENHDKSH
jgi:coenzyme F420 hydrogenase subunit beta